MTTRRCLQIFLLLSLISLSTFIPHSSTISQNLEKVYFPALSVRNWPYRSEFLNSIGGFSNFLLASHHLAFVGNGSNLLIFDTSSGGAPSYLSEVALPGPPTSVQRSGDLLFVTAGYGGLVIADITHPAQAQIAGIFQVPGFSAHVTVVDNIAHLSTSQQLITLDVSYPNHLVVLNVQENPSSISFRNGNLLYYGDYGVHILDVSDPAHPVALGESPIGKFWTMSGDIAFTITEPGCYPFNCYYNIHFIDVGDPYNPQPVGGYSVDRESDTGFFVHGEFVVITSGNLLDVSAITESGQLDQQGHYEAGGRISSVSFADNLAILGIEQSSIELLDLSDPSDPELISTYTASPVNCISTGFIDNKLLCRIDKSDSYYLDDAALQVIDFTALEHPVFAGEIYLGPGMNALKTQVENDRLYLVGSNTENYKNPASSEEAINSFLKIYDINNPAQPEELGIYDLEQGIYGLYRSFQIQDEIGYFLKYPRAGWAPPDFDVVDLRDPTQPTLIARYSDSFLYRFRLQDNFLYRVTEYQDKAGKGFDILDATNPVSITLLSSINISTTFGYVPGFDVSENYAYIGVEDDATKALHIIDISDPLLPLPGSIYTLTNIPSQPFLEAIEVNGNLALVGYTWGLQLLDITQPLAPVHLSDIEICGEIVDLQMVADLVYVACRSNGAQIIDISDPSHPQIIREYGGTITGINTGVDLPVYLSAYNDGLLIYKQPRFGE